MSERTFARSARRFVRNGLRRLQRDAADTLASGGDDELHALRIRAKVLRYRLEFAAPLLADGGRTPLRQLALLQDHLGALADAAAFTRTYRELLDGLPGTDARRVGLERLLGNAQRERERALGTLKALWFGTPPPSDPA